ncbi:3TM-type holin [Litchfieldella xinjiangensis]|uniref:3TM-type holin n=1 Tax=Litchfieldella xinjiangensis TaxID=1166948 RepID=UPI0018CFBA50|nr:3TM-type holin [Halomonas xinjiangensis]
MKWSDVAETVAKVAPVVGGALGGPAGAAVGSLAARALGVEPTPEAVARAIHDDPEAAVKLRKIEADLEAIRIEAQASVITAEANGESYLQRNWRPILMLVITAIVANNYIIAPYLGAMFGSALTLDLPERLWDLMTLGVGGYIGGRTIEKVTRGSSGKGLMDRIKTR